MDGVISFAESNGAHDLVRIHTLTDEPALDALRSLFGELLIMLWRTFVTCKSLDLYSKRWALIDEVLDLIEIAHVVRLGCVELIRVDHKERPWEVEDRVDLRV